MSVSLDGLLQSPVAQLVLALLLGGVAASGRFSIIATRILLLSAWAVALVGLRHLQTSLLMYIGILGGFALILLDRWLKPTPSTSVSQPILAVEGPVAFRDQARVKYWHWRIRVINSGAVPAQGVRMRLNNITPAPRDASWRPDYPYPVKRATGTTDPVTINLNDDEFFEIIVGWPNSEGIFYTDGLDTKATAYRNAIRIEPDERWALEYLVTAENAPPIPVRVIIYLDENTGIIAKKG